MKCTLYHEKVDFMFRVQIYLLDLFGKHSRQENPLCCVRHNHIYILKKVQIILSAMFLTKIADKKNLNLKLKQKGATSKISF